MAHRTVWSDGAHAKAPVTLGDEAPGSAPHAAGDAWPPGASAGESGFRLRYRASLDGLRGVAVLVVMAFHAQLPLVGGGFLGVDVFFVLSGFLITALLMQEWEQTGSVSLGNFYARRALRLLPALLTQLSIILAVPRLFMPAHIVAWKAALIVLFYAGNWTSAFQLFYLHVLQPTWSLAIEEQFYLVWPPVLRLLLVLRVGRAWILLLVLLGIEAAAVARVALWEPTHAGWARVYFGLDTRMDSLLLGCLVGLLAAWDMLPKRPWLVRVTRGAGLLALVVLGALFHLARDTSMYQFYGLGLLACVAVAVLLVALITAPPALAIWGLEQPALVWIGRISYGLYLWHFPIFFGVLRAVRMAPLGIAGPALTLLRFAAVFAVATGSFYFIERPALLLKERFRVRGAGFPSPPGSRAVQPATRRRRDAMPAPGADP